MQLAKQMRFRSNWRRSEAVDSSPRPSMVFIQREQKSALAFIDPNGVNRGEGLRYFVWVAYVGTQQRSVELDMLGFLEQLPLKSTAGPQAC